MVLKIAENSLFGGYSTIVKNRSIGMCHKFLSKVSIRYLNGMLSLIKSFYLGDIAPMVCILAIFRVLQAKSGLTFDVLGHF